MSEQCPEKRQRKEEPCPGFSRKAVVLEAGAARLRIDPAGGSLAAFQLLEEGGIYSMNPLSWDCAVHDGKPSVDATDPRPLGHFLCLDRWGPPTEAEEANGMGYHGEATCVHWETSDVENGNRNVNMSAALPIAGLQVKREVKLVDTMKDSATPIVTEMAALVFVSEAVKNCNKLGRIYNMVQHPSIAAPFLDEDTVVDCNGKRGFAQGPNRTYAEHPEKPTFNYPQTINRAGSQANVRSMTGGDDDVTSYEVDPSSNIGWVCATNRKDGLVFGYLWPRTDYPWISLWCSSSSDGKPRARGIEFGTTGLHQPHNILVRHPRIFDLPTFEYLDTGESRSRSYASFVLRVPNDFKGVKSLQIEGKVLTLSEVTPADHVTDPPASRTYSIASQELFSSHGF